MLAKRLLSIVVVSLFLVSAIFAQPQPGQNPPMGPPPAHGKMYQALNLTDQQRSQIEDLHLALEKKMIPLRADLQKLNADYKLMLIDPKVSESALKAQLQKIADLRIKMALERAKNQRKIRSLLNAEQKKKFDAMILNGPKHKKMMGRQMMHRPSKMAPRGHRMRR